MFNYRGYVAKDTPVDVKNSNILSLVLFKQSTLVAIANECLPYAGNSEFQVHYRSVIVRLKNVTNELIVTVPTAFFNFKQTVATASVNFATIDEGTAAEASKPSSNAIIPALLQEFPALQALKAYAEHNGFEYSIVESNSGSIHRHPGDFSFSSIDRDKSPDEPGVIYRHLNAVNAVKTDSVIYLPAHGTAKIVTTETRIVNVQESTNGITGTYLEVPTITCILKDTAPVAQIIDTFNTLLGDTDSEDPSLPYTFVRASGASTKEYPLVTEILNQFAATTTTANLTNVIGANIEERKFFTYNYSKPKAKGGGIQIWDREQGKLVAAEYDATSGQYVPIKENPYAVPVTVISSKPEEHIVTAQHKNPGFLYDNDSYVYH